MEPRFCYYLKAFRVSLLDSCLHMHGNWFLPQSGLLNRIKVCAVA